MRDAIESYIVKLFLFFGLKISRVQKSNFIRDMDIKTIIDIGAHTGESAIKFHKLMPNAMIYSIEPLYDCFLQLNKNLRHVKNFKAFNIAIGEREGKINMHRSKYSASSSLRKMGDLHKKTFPYSDGEIMESVDITTLDELSLNIDLYPNILLKIDVQGYEDNVLKGGKTMLNNIKIIIIETSFLELYEGQPLFKNIHDMLNEKGFSYAGCLDQLNNPIDCMPLQQDSIFLKNY